MGDPWFLLPQDSCDARLSALWVGMQLATLSTDAPGAMCCGYAPVEAAGVAGPAQELSEIAAAAPRHRGEGPAHPDVVLGRARAVSA